MTTTLTVINGRLRQSETGGQLVLSPKSGGNEPCCCKCTPCTMARYTTNNANPIFDLTPYKCAGKEYAGQPWRLIEVGYVATYASGIIDSYGYLLGLQNQFRSSYFYNGYMELQIGCKSAAESTTGSQWPVARTAPTCAIGSCL